MWKSFQRNGVTVSELFGITWSLNVIWSLFKSMLYSDKQWALTNNTNKWLSFCRCWELPLNAHSTSLTVALLASLSHCTYCSSANWLPSQLVLNSGIRWLCHHESWDILIRYPGTMYPGIGWPKKDPPIGCRHFSPTFRTTYRSNTVTLTSGPQM